MTNTTTSKSNAPEGGTLAAGSAINDNGLSTSQYDGQVFLTQRDALTLKSETPRRRDTAECPVAYWAERWGLMRLLPSIDSARRLLEQIGGRL